MTKVTINDQLLASATAALSQPGSIAEAVSVSGGGVTAVLSPHSDDMLSALQEITHDGTTYYLGLPNE